MPDIQLYSNFDTISAVLFEQQNVRFCACAVCCTYHIYLGMDLLTFAREWQTLFGFLNNFVLPFAEITSGF